MFNAVCSNLVLPPSLKVLMIYTCWATNWRYFAHSHLWSWMSSVNETKKVIISPKNTLHSLQEYQNFLKNLGNNLEKLANNGRVELPSWYAYFKLLWKNQKMRENNVTKEAAKICTKIFKKLAACWNNNNKQSKHSSMCSKHLQKRKQKVVCVFNKCQCWRCGQSRYSKCLPS